ncbi:hypothetical protein DES53_116106 [Roseimicrobium gellanilyticum]|uniref:Ribosomal RNA methyltransferase FtsJ domain-containing protein n=1 Tax=Roseimicrobium gellanilyticum TaxID=748857 RepID=A0A366H6U7_9BACT|nr:SAM-dependent methyltransferase [Roseimicrobium gellanilyticum]RBP36667.1 hypothetical protein DES53_116106 [Roseimicrobium gellanilyticum]
MPPSSLSTHGHLIRISQVFQEQTAGIFSRLGISKTSALGQEYHWAKDFTAESIADQTASIFMRWHIPVHHAWPCNPQKMEGFIERAAQAMLKKFGGLDVQTILVGQLSSGSASGYYKHLASNLRGRVLQLFPEVAARGLDAESQDPGKSTLFCLVGREGLYCGVQSPRAANGFYPGGTKFIAQGDENTISRAGAKIAEALHYLRLHRSAPPEGSHWLELGASPGGMTSELLNRDYRVTAVDRAPLDARLRHERQLLFVQCDVAEFQPPAAARYDALLCDLNGEAADSMQQVIRLAPSLKSGGLVVFTLKMPGIATVHGALTLVDEVCSAASQAGLRVVAQTHLSYNRHEFTVFLEKV